MRGVEFSLFDRRDSFAIDPAGTHEAQSLTDPARHLLISFGEGAVLDEFEVPAMNAVKVCITAIGKSTE